MVRNLPAYVNCVIVPFEDRVVYLRSMMEYPVSVGENMRKMVSDDLARIRKEGRLIQTADQLVAAQPAILEAKTRRNATAKSDADFQLHGPSQAYLDGLEGMPKGQHRGKMAGLSWEERKKATQDQIRQRVLARAMPTLAKTHAFKGPEVCSLSGLLAKRTKDQLQELAFVLDMSGVSKLRKQELVDAVAEELDVQLPIYLDAVESATGAEPAGIFYFHLSPQTQKGSYETTEDEQLKEILMQARLDGIVLNDMHIIEMMDQEIEKKSWVIPVSLNKNGSLSSNSKAVDAAQFEDLRRFAHAKASEIGGQIASGDIKARPIAKTGGQEPACLTCAFRGACRLDVDREQQYFRMRENHNGEDFWKKIQEKEL